MYWADMSSCIRSGWNVVNNWNGDAMRKKRKIIYWLLAGIWISLALAAVIRTPEGDLHQFYQDGKVDDWTMAWMMEGAACGRYDAANSIYTTEAQTGAMGINQERSEEPATQIKMDITDLDKTGSLWRTEYFDKNGNLLEREDFEVDGEEFCIKLWDGDYETLRFSLMDDRTTRLKVNSILLEEHEKTVGVTDILVTAAVIYLVWAVAGVLIYMFCRKKKISDGSGMEAVVTFLEGKADQILDAMTRVRDPGQNASMVRIFCIIWVVIGWRVTNVYGVNKYYGYIVLLTIILYLALAAHIPMGKTKRDRNVPLIGIWLILYGFQLLSDLFTQKAYGFGEVWMLLCFGLLYRAWNRMEKPEKLLDDFATAMLILNTINILYFWIGNGKLYNDGRPAGTWSNPNPFAIGMVLYEAILLFLLYQAVRQRKKWWYYLLPGIEFLCGIWMIYVAQCRTAMLAFGLMLLWFLAFLVAGKMQLSRKKAVALAVAMAVVVVVLGVGFVLYAGSRLSNRTIDISSANGLTSGRVWIWKEYLCHMNLIGHEKYLVVAGRNWFAHNGIVKNFYKFGLFAGIAYVLLWLETLYAALKYWMREKRSEYTVFVMGVLIAYFVPAMMESMDEIPMVWLGWVAFYFMIGYLMQENGSKNREKIDE